MSTLTVSFSDLQARLYESAKTQGWHQVQRSVSDDLILMHSEVSEVYMEAIDGRSATEIYYKDGKPEGIPIEIADLLIRILAFAHSYDIDFQRYVDIAGESDMDGMYDDVPIDVVAASARWHARLSRSMEIWRKGSEVLDLIMSDTYTDGVMVQMAHLWLDVSKWCNIVGIDIMSSIDIKDTFNQTRPWRHGGKRI